MTKNTKVVLVLLLLIVLIAVVPLLTIQDSEFGGADGAAEEAITKINPTYIPWAESLVEPPGGETESLLFCLQAGIGAGIFGFGFGYLVARKKFQKGA
ncbi:energy-coupling factor ABC transporter substrate-binding protein [Sinanaerobacter chloroacetimidivorans]|uniref:Cobalt transport protein CbiN n=1 Tax=Sinanaerobacter chloroacetimidivorans TaxID=2818044 RepID=A0A8J8B0M3_9FIRM|nr:energy-coupling factor ABC transporter substrate-binding protein [Sinanaerobacter chloroacetimidivorans]MBR0597324.1 energy-coupling factor ABC transporter substrate-binding protein [Sinanaerobacter chloroacetimidivorans]